MCSGLGPYRCPSDKKIVEKLRVVNYTSIRQICDINFNTRSIPQMYGIDARSIPPEIASWSNLIWFQCPWIVGDSGPGIAKLIRAFLASAARNCVPGTCVGITRYYIFTYRYHLELILGDKLDGCTLDQYEFLGVDDVLIEKLLSYGYIHQGYSDIHDKIRYHHVTLVFKLNRKEEVSSGLGM